MQDVFAKNIVIHRHKLSMTQEQLADVCNYHRTYVGSVERGERNVTLATIEAFAKAFGVESYTLLLSSNE